MSAELNLKRADLVNSRNVEFDDLCNDIFDSFKIKSLKSIQLHPSTRRQDIYKSVVHYFGAENVSFLDSERVKHANGISVNEPAIPDMVVYPSHIEQIQWLANLANSNQISLIPYGKGGSIKINSASCRGFISIDMRKMSRVLEFNPEDQEICVETGMTKNALSNYLYGSNLFLPLDIECDATIGGLISSNASGSGSFYYGSMKSRVLSLKIVMPDGTIIVAGNKTTKQSSDCDFKSLFIGSEGSFGIVVEAVLRLEPVPKSFGAAYAKFDNLEDAVNCATKLIRQGLSLQRCEILDNHAMVALNKYHGTKFDELAHIFLECHGNSRAAVDFTLDDCKDICREGGSKEFAQFNEESEEIPMIWRARSTVWMSIAQFYQIIAINVAVPLSKVNEMIKYAKKDFDLSKIEYSPIIAHIGDGSLFFLVPIDFQDQAAIDQIESIFSKFSKRAHALGGAFSISNGFAPNDPQTLKSEQELEVSHILRSIKAAIDPINILNHEKASVYGRENTFYYATLNS